MKGGQTQGGMIANLLDLMKAARLHWCTLEELREATGLNEETVRRYMARAIEHGLFLEIGPPVRRGAGNAGRYTLAPAWGGKAGPAPKVGARS